MSRVLLILRSKMDRELAASWVKNAPYGTRLEFKEAKRTVPQNDRMWALLTDVARQVDYHGLRLSPADWKLIFLDALKREVRMVPNLDGNGFVSLGRSSSDLSKSEMSDLMALIEEFAARNGVVFTDDGAVGKGAAA
ncbi:recombination protein NinB [Xanthobacter sp. V3C-3]|uniref:recombination protein NinB n=1 Tax=Xanthobacter lutulentifluminis TaxID=3119935 RepID=UPI00372A9408